MAAPRKRFCPKGHDKEVAGVIKRQCRLCYNAYYRNYKQKNKEYVREIERKYYQKKGYLRRRERTLRDKRTRASKGISSEILPDNK